MATATPAEHRGHDPDGRVAARAERNLAQRRPEGQPEVERQRDQVERLAASLRWRQVAGRREHRYEKERLGDAERTAHDDEGGQR